MTYLQQDELVNGDSLAAGEDPVGHDVQSAGTCFCFGRNYEVRAFGDVTGGDTHGAEVRSPAQKDVMRGIIANGNQREVRGSLRIVSII